jgi:hypothetical protein
VARARRALAVLRVRGWRGLGARGLCTLSLRLMPRYCLTRVSLATVLLLPIYVTRSGELGPDFLDPDSLPGTPQWWDMTTRGEWAQHVIDYAGFGNGTPLFTR